MTDLRRTQSRDKSGMAARDIAEVTSRNLLMGELKEEGMEDSHVWVRAQMAMPVMEETRGPGLGEK